MKYLVRHSTVYDYAEPVTLSHNIVRLRPRASGSQECLQYKLEVAPAPDTQTEWLDYFGNYSHYFCIQTGHRQLKITAKSEIAVTPPPRPDTSSVPSWEQARDVLRQPNDPEARAALEFSFDSRYISRAAELVSYASPSFPPGRSLLECCLELTERIHRDFEFRPGSTGVGTPVDQVLRTRRGVCQDFAHLEIGCLRSLGLAARYVSGYLATTPPPGQPHLQGADVSHAWVSVFVPGWGWTDFDPTNGIMPSDAHIVLAWARDYDDLGPIRGILVGGGPQELQVSVDVLPIEDSAQPNQK